MAALFLEILQKEFDFTEEDTKLMSRTLRQQNRTDRRYYFQNIKVREKKFINSLKQHYQALGSDGQKQWLDALLQSMLDRGGEPDLSDALVMKIIGPLTVYNQLRLKSESEGVKLKLLVNFGGMGTVIMLVGAITALVLYLLAR
ncbi:hypothetical protein SPSYN_02468 [Sporotomaculum syntrophicum]|uniref:Uncharacterized protein n=1 Tax=Sporotomaculum syntrophicum TaxID=182264 RepID=A0A9D3AYE5_9FIRM|nr:hypothetical protein [Sporotomaculum syntrophicum]KAF1084688.1 hypothetical protein SPSYN_02468 [Sporotomaculum syntrophicum]